MCNNTKLIVINLENFNYKNNWEFVSDQVMGGISIRTYELKKIRIIMYF